MNLKEYHDARYPFVWFETTEEDRIIRESRAVFPDETNIFVWDILSGFSRINGDSIPIPVSNQNDVAIPERPRLALQQVPGLPPDSLIFMKDFHKFFEQISISRQALNIKGTLKENGQTIAFLAAGSNIPVELKNDITVDDFRYPDESELMEILGMVSEDNKLEIPKDSETIVNAMRGLTWEGAENTLALSLARHGCFDTATILKQRATQIASGGIMEFGNYTEKLKDLYGLDTMIDYILKTIKSPKARGVLIYGTPGSGKSHTAKGLANELGWPCIILKFSALKDKYQGVAESKLRDSFKSIRAVGRCIVFMDEIEAIATGISSGGDNGVGQTLYKELLMEMEDSRGKGAYWVGTCNDLGPLIHESGGAILRRFSGIFFADLPDEEQARGIAKIWERKEGVNIPESFSLDGYSGADIAKLAETMAMMDCTAEDASRFVLPYGKAHKDQLELIRQKAEGTCIWASPRKGVASLSSLRSSRKVKVV